jgi:hypothetical protein
MILVGWGHRGWQPLPRITGTLTCLYLDFIEMLTSPRSENVIGLLRRNTASPVYIFLESLVRAIS